MVSPIRARVVVVDEQDIDVSRGVPLAVDTIGSAGGVGAVILTVPAGRVWRGSISLSVSANNSIGSSSSTAEGGVTLGGTGVAPAEGTLISAAIALPGVAATGTSGASGSISNTIPDVFIIAGSSNATLTVFGPAATRATARGSLVA